MAILRRSCFGSVKTGSYVVAGIWIILTLCGLGYTSCRVAISISALGLPALTDVIIMVVYVLNFIAHILLICGLTQEVPHLILNWVHTTIVCTYTTLIVHIYVTVMIYTQIDTGSLFEYIRIVPGSYRTYESAILGAGIASTVVRWSIWGVFFLLTVYSCLVVYSHYQNLRNAAISREQHAQQMVDMGNQPAMQGNQPYDNQPYGNQPYGNQPVLENRQPAMTGPQPALGQDSFDARL